MALVSKGSRQSMASAAKPSMPQRQQHSQISGLLASSMTNNQLTDDQDDITGTVITLTLFYSRGAIKRYDALKQHT